jgi:hypothetical protein
LSHPNISPDSSNLALAASVIAVLAFNGRVFSPHGTVQPDRIAAEFA